MFNKNKTILLCYPAAKENIDYIIPESVSSIGDRAFANCYSLTSVTIPEKVSSIEFGTFWGCTSLESITIPESVTSIGSMAFCKCTSLTSVTIPKSVTAIQENTFANYNSLTSVTLPMSMTSIRYRAFDSCFQLTDIYILATTPPVIAYGSDPFENVSIEEVTLYVPENAVSAYTLAYGWKDFKIIGLPSSVYSIEGSNSESVEFYDLKGFKVSLQTPGLYIKRHGNKITKVFVK